MSATFTEDSILKGEPKLEVSTTFLQTWFLVKIYGEKFD